MLALITHNVIPLRAEPDNGSEPVSQAIMGDRMEVREERGEFVYVCTSDAYQGWILRQFLRACAPDDPFLASSKDPAVRRHRILAPIADVFKRSEPLSDLLTKLVLGTPVQVVARTTCPSDPYTRILMPNGSLGYVCPEALESASAPPRSLPEICAFARRYIGIPYLWGGTTPFGFDCSGFVQRMFSLAAIPLPRDAYLQAQSPLGKSVPPGSPLRAGDLVFFCGQSDPRGRGITHVGLALNRRQFIHANSRTGITITGLEDPDIRRIYTYRGAWRYTPVRRIGG